MPDYQTTCTDPSSDMYFLLPVLYLVCTTNQRSIQIGYLLLSASGSSESSHVFSGVLIAEEFDGVGDKESGDTTAVHVQTLLKAFLNIFHRSTSFIDEAFSGKNQNFWSWDYSAARLSDARLKELYIL